MHVIGEITIRSSVDAVRSLLRVFIVFECSQQLPIDSVHPGLLGRPDALNKSNVTSTCSRDQHSIGILLKCSVGYGYVQRRRNKILLSHKISIYSACIYNILSLTSSSHSILTRFYLKL